MATAISACSDVTITTEEYKELIAAKAKLDVIGEAYRRSKYDSDVGMIIRVTLGIERDGNE